MSKICREFESEASTVEEMLDHVICNREHVFALSPVHTGDYSRRCGQGCMCLESGDGSGTFRNWRQRVIPNETGT